MTIANTSHNGLILDLANPPLESVVGWDLNFLMDFAKTTGGSIGWHAR
ncbi:MAG TPA: hypothetical protein VGZ48_11135 [Candidatus Acidoferrales bacterium]|nr:hypothetical protein [Candidatus Acidoferrales bacterium]